MDLKELFAGIAKSVRGISGTEQDIRALELPGVIATAETVDEDMDADLGRLEAAVGTQGADL